MEIPSKARNKTTIWLLAIYPEETKIEKDTCIPLFIAALLTIARTWKQHRCPSTDEWIKKMCYIYTKEYYSAIKRNAFQSVQLRCMSLEPNMQSEVSQKEILRITIKCGTFWKRWEYQTTWPASFYFFFWPAPWETCMQVKKQQLELDMEQQTGSK